MSQTTTSTLQSCSICAKQFNASELVTYQTDRICAGCKETYFQRIREGVEQVSPEKLHFAGIGARFLATIIDGLITSGVQMVLNLIFIGSLIRLPGNDAGVFSSIIVMALSMIFGVVYYVLFLGSKGATPGKMAMGIVVVSPTGKSIGYGRALLRYIGAFLSGIILGIGYFMAFFDNENKALHDRIAGTRVVYRNKQS